MTSPVPSLLVAVVDHAAIVKVNGRANFTTSVTFKRLFNELRERGFERFVLDLSDCVTMDSTFLGVLAGTALKLSERRGFRNGDSKLSLVNPNPRVADLLDNLGVADLFRTLRCEAPVPANAELAPATVAEPSREELSRACLEAHEILMQLSPENALRFKDVTHFLAEDLKKVTAQAEESEKKPETNGAGRGPGQ
jgi:anti-anti-sigma factor